MVSSNLMFSPNETDEEASSKILVDIIQVAKSLTAFSNALISNDSQINKLQVDSQLNTWIQYLEDHSKVSRDTTK